MPRITIFFIGLAVALTPNSIPIVPAAACGGPLDVACNVGKAIEKGAHDAGRTGGQIINQGRTDLSNGLNRIDPRLTQIGRDIDRWRLEFQSSVFTGPALEQWLWASRNSAMNGAMPMPPEIMQALQGWYDPGLMNMVRFKVGDGGALNLANNSIRIGTAEAVTLIDVIVFKGPSEAADPALWAHEMKHVQQFRDWGVHSFAVQYMRSWNSVEDPAYAVQNQYAQRRAMGQVPGPVGNGGQQLGAFCLTPIGRFGPGPIQPVGSPCGVMTAQGQVAGQVGF
jgi:hypothetical protein